ncbi:MAG: GYF domain-containing protein [Pirellulales bacterium]
MAETEWFYGKDGKELGPASSDQLRQLAQRGELAADDLVWSEGMSDWAEARRVKLLTGLFPPEASPPAALHVRDEDRSLAARAASKRAPRLPAVLLPTDFAGFARTFGVPLLMVGIVLVVFARGLDSLGNRGVARMKAKSAAAVDQFNDDWEARRLALEARIEAIREQEAPSERDAQRLDELLEQQAELTEQRAAARQEAERTTWRNWQIAARDAERNNAMWAYWREWLFVLGSILLTCGLLSVGFHGGGSERMICLIMLAIITFSLYVGGFAWSGSFTLP